MDTCCLSIFPTSLRRLRNFWQSDSYNVGNCNKNKKKIDQAERNTDKENVVEIVVKRKKRQSEGSLIG